MEEQLIMFLVGVPLLGVAAQWFAWRLRLPAILLLLVCGIALGQFVNPDKLLAELTGGDPVNGPRLLFPAVSLAVAVILFEGGLSLRFHELKQSGPVVFRLVTLGVAVTWLLAAVSAWYVFDLRIQIAALAGAILVVTGPTVVGPLLRHIRPTRRIASIAKWEGIVVDPIGAILAVLVFEQVFAAEQIPTVFSVSWTLFRCVAIASVLGLLTAWLLVDAVKRFWLPDYLQGVAFLVVALSTFAISNALQAESGLATVTVLGILLANQRQISIRHVVEFNEQLGVLLISCLFVVLGSRIDVHDLHALGIGGAIFLVLLIAVVRPVSVLVAAIGTPTTMRERVFLAFIAPRGIVAAAVASVFALKVATIANEDVLLAHQAEQLVPITFLVIVGTVTVYGLFTAPLARFLGLADPNPQGLLIAGASRCVREIATVLISEGYPILLLDTNDTEVGIARFAGLPAECMNVLSEAVYNELDLSGIGRLLAMTSNHEANTMAARELVHLFGRANVYQLPGNGQSPRHALAQHLCGRPLFGKDVTAKELERRIERGHLVKKTKLTEEFTWHDFSERYGPTAILLFVLKAENTLQVCTADRTLDPKAGQTVIAVVDPNYQPVDAPSDA